MFYSVLRTISRACTQSLILLTDERHVFVQVYLLTGEEIGLIRFSYLCEPARKVTPIDCLCVSTTFQLLLIIIHSFLYLLSRHFHFIRLFCPVVGHFVDYQVGFIRGFDGL